MAVLPETLDDALQQRSVVLLSVIQRIILGLGVLTVLVDLSEGVGLAGFGMRLVEFGLLLLMVRLASQDTARWRHWLLLLFCWWGFSDALCNALLLPVGSVVGSAALVPIGAGLFPFALRVSLARFGAVVVSSTAGLALGGIVEPGVLVTPLVGGVVGAAFSQALYRAEVQSWELREAALAASEARGSFLARVSHEMRTPLNGVIGMLNAVRAEPLSPGQREALQIAEQSSHLLRTTIDDVLAFSAGNAGALTLRQQPFDIVPLLERFVSTVVPPSTAVTVRLEEGAPTPRLEGDPNRIQQIVHHLVKNGIRFTPAGEVVVRVSWDGQLCIEVLDQGPGLPEPLQDLIVAFAQGDESSQRRHGGTGLGLALTQQLVDVMGGTLAAHNRPSGGAHMTVTLPIPVAPPRHAGPPAPIALRGVVLIVDDNLINRRVLRRLVEALGASVEEAADGAEGLEKMLSTPYRLVLMDHHMPEMDGLEATRRARAGGFRSPIVAVTASAQPGAREASFAAGMDAHLTKPIGAASLTQTIADILQRTEAPLREAVP